MRTSFLKIMEMRDGTAITIADAITKLCTDLDVNMLHCFYGLGSDGASVMLGKEVYPNSSGSRFTS